MFRWSYSLTVRVPISPFAKLMSGFLDNFSPDADIRPVDDPLSLYLTRETCAARASAAARRPRESLSFEVSYHAAAFHSV